MHPRCEGFGYFFGERQNRSRLGQPGAHDSYGLEIVRCEGTRLLLWVKLRRTADPVNRTVPRLYEEDVLKRLAGAKALGYFSRKEKTRVRIPSGSPEQVV